jgi:hypothetical protein
MHQSIPLNLESCPLVCTCSFKTFSLENLFRFLRFRDPLMDASEND